MNRDQLPYLRKDYVQAELLEALAPHNPLELFRQWFALAIQSGLPEPNAMTLATVSSNMRPSARIVLMKDCDEQGLVWYTHYTSRKGQELSGNPHAALQFHWVELEQVVRIEGLVERVDCATSDAYFATRPRQSQIGAWASPQSHTLMDRADLDQRVEKMESLHHQEQSVKRPESWGGYRLKPNYWEFWQGRPSRLHDRLCYSMNAKGVWDRKRLAP